MSRPDMTVVESSRIEVLVDDNLGSSLRRLARSLSTGALLLSAYLALAWLDPAPVLALPEAAIGALQLLDFLLWGAVASLMLMASMRATRLIEPLVLMLRTEGSDRRSLGRLIIRVGSVVRDSGTGFFWVAGLIGVSALLGLAAW